MRGTDELREYARIHQPYKSELYNAQCADEITAIADRIDAEHESKVAEVASGWDYWESTHIELPKDADGEYIHIGDEVETIDFGTVEVEGFVHHAVAFYSYSKQPAYLCTTPANLCHHHAPTVEDVLREFADEVYADADNEIRDRDFLCAKYAKRLTLAEGEDA